MRTEQRKREKDGKKKLRSGKEYGSALVSNDDDSSIFSHTSKAMKLMTITDNKDTKSVGTLSMMDDEGASTITSNLRKLNEAENKIDAEIDDLAQY